MPKLRQPKHEQFAREVVSGAAIKDAYVAAGFKPHSMNGNRLMRPPEVAARIDELQREAAARSEITADRILIEAGRIAFSNFKSFIESDGGKMRFRDMAQLPDGITAAIAELRLDDEGRPIFRLHPKMPALNLLAEYFGLINGNGNGEFDVNDPLAQVLKQLDGRTRGLPAVRGAESLNDAQLEIIAKYGKPETDAEK